MRFQALHSFGRIRVTKTRKTEDWPDILRIKIHLYKQKLLVFLMCNIYRDVPAKVRCTFASPQPDDLGIQASEYVPHFLENGGLHCMDKQPSPFRESSV